VKGKTASNGRAGRPARCLKRAKSIIATRIATVLRTGMNLIFCSILSPIVQLQEITLGVVEIERALAVTKDRSHLQVHTPFFQLP
jgi:hypothetical protein